MSKLFKLKNWLTIDEAAKHLSGDFTELVTEADVLRLALDGRLKLSVNFVNPVVVKLGTLIAKEDVPYEEVVGKNGNKFRHYISKQHVTDDGRIYVYDAKDPAYTLRGVCDVPMGDGFRLEVERRYQCITGGPKMTGSWVGGVLVEVVDMDLCQFEMCMDEPDFPDAGDCGKLLIEAMAASPLSTEQQFELVKRGLEVINRTSEYCIVDQLPEESLLVVRRNSLTDFISSVSDTPPTMEKRPDDPDNEGVAGDNFDPADLPDELYMANLAFRAVTNGYGEQSDTFRNRIISYLKLTYPNLKNDPLQRIATVGNPDKSTGRKRRSPE
jgi:hypothetical protein